MNEKIVLRGQKGNEFDLTVIKIYWNLKKGQKTKANIGYGRSDNNEWIEQQETCF